MADHQNLAKNVKPINRSLLGRARAWVFSEEDDAASRNIKQKGDGEGARSEASLKLWSQERIEILNILWGEGNRFPGTENFNKRIFDTHKLNSKSHVLDVAAGFGAMARMIARDHFSHVTVVNNYPELLPFLKKQVVESDLAHFINIVEDGFENNEIPKGKYDLICGREVFFKIKNKQNAFEKCMDALKPKGSFIFTDFVLDDRATVKSSFKHWSERERRQVYPVTLSYYKKMFKGMELKSMPAQDLSQAYSRQVNKGWLRLKAYLKENEVDDNFVNITSLEGDLWLSRVRALRSGKLKLLRFQVFL